LTQDVQVGQALLITTHRIAGMNHLRVIIIIEVIMDLPTPVEEDELLILITIFSLLWMHGMNLK
jgi:hypothetical protein